MVGTITHHVKMGEARIRVVFEVVRQLVLPVLDGTSFIDKNVRGIFPEESKIVPHNSEPVHLFAVLDEAQTREDREEERLVRVARTGSWHHCRKRLCLYAPLLVES